MSTLIFLYPLTQHQLETDELKIGLQQVTVSECYGMGRIYTAQDLVDKDLDKFIPTEIEKQNPRWIIAEGRCATEVLKLKGIKKVLINPHVIEQESDVSDFDKDNTWGFFDALHEREIMRISAVVLTTQPFIRWTMSYRYSTSRKLWKQ